MTKSFSDFGDSAIDRAVELIKGFEGVSLEAYLCPAHVWTIGYGHTLGVTKGMTITQDEAERLLRNDVLDVMRRLDSLITVPITEGQFAALVSLVFNIGVVAFKKSTLLRKLNRGDYLGAGAEFDRWKYSNGKVLGGLVRRRAKEREVFYSEYL